MHKSRRALSTFVLLLMMLAMNFGPAVQAMQVPGPEINSGSAAAPVSQNAASQTGPAPTGTLDTSGGRVLPLSLAPLTLTGPQQAAVLRVRFHNYANTSRYSQTQVQGFFDNEINKMWNRISYGNITIQATVSDLYLLPNNRSSYVTDHSDGDTSDGGQYMAVLNDAVAQANAAGFNFTGVKFVMVLMAETDATQYHRGQANKCNLPIGPEVTYFGVTFHQMLLVGCAVFSENPADPDARVWGRWMHEMGHTFQVAGPAHPSNYDNSFELMDRLYPGHSGMFEKQASVAFPGWIDPSVYKVLAPGVSGSADIYAEEYQPSDLPNGGVRAMKVEVTPSVYYIISVRGKINGDEVRPIPDEGVLIERVVEGASQWVTVVPPTGGTADKLWQVGDHYSNSSDGVFLDVISRPSPSVLDFLVDVKRDAASRPDLMIRSWLSAPLNTYETSDIWVDSSCNGYGSFMYGTYTPGGDSTAVGYGNGDSPCANHHNRLYARIRNIGTGTASNVVVHFQVTDPMGVGMNQSTWADIGTVTMADPGGAGLASIPAGAYTDVYTDWVPSISLTPQQMASGTFNFHTCVRVLIDAAPNEANKSNQDGIDEQENIDQFFFQPSDTISSQQADFILHVRNNDPINPRTFIVSWETNLPPGWEYVVNDNRDDLEIPAGGLADVPIKIQRVGPAAAGEVYTIKVKASYMHLLQPNPPVIDPFNGLPDIHVESQELAGATIGIAVAKPTRIHIRATREGNGGIQVVGQLVPALPNREFPINVDLLDGKHQVLNSYHPIVGPDGTFRLDISPNDEFARMAVFASAIYQGTADMTGKTTDFLAPSYGEALVATDYNFLPSVAR